MGVTLLSSPFVGFIFDWHVANRGKKCHEPQEDPELKNVTNMYSYYKKFGYKTVVMGTSFSIGEINALAWSNFLHCLIQAPGEMLLDNTTLTPVLFIKAAQAGDLENVHLERRPSIGCTLRTKWLQRCSHGICRFASDARKLERILMEQVLSAENGK